MKLAKKRLPPTIAKLFSGARSARRAVMKACAAVSVSEKRMRRREQAHASTKESLEQMLASFDSKRHSGEAMPFPPVGSEVLPNYPPDGGQLTPSELASIRETAQPLLPKGKVIRRRSIV
ncbi:MAG: hypothetical protein Q7K57_07185 [Burkholderiaceae bacterium]|nr:hypothetical protein [Burkholderiaceae bacterium]